MRSLQRSTRDWHGARSRQMSEYGRMRMRIVVMLFTFHFSNGIELHVHLWLNTPTIQSIVSLRFLHSKNVPYSSIFRVVCKEHNAKSDEPAMAVM